MINVLKIVFLGIIGFAVLVYLTAPEDRLNPKDTKSLQNKLTVGLLPTHFELVGEGNYFRKEELFKKGVESYIIVANHDSLVVLNQLYKFTDKNVLLVANVSKTPWVIKKLAVDGKLEDLYKDSRYKIVNDSNGKVVNALLLNDIIQTKYFIYKVDTKGYITKLSEGNVKLDALQKGISEEEINKTLESISNALK